MPPPRAPDSSHQNSRACVTAKRAQKEEESEPEDDGLCCCEYVDLRGERSHMAASCCDCEDLDEACDRWLKRRPQRPGAAARLLATVSDRARLPGLCGGGARKVDPSVIAPVVLVPALLHVAALHFLAGAAVLVAVPGALAWYYRLARRRKEVEGRRTRFFLGLTLASAGYACYVFVAEVSPRIGGEGSAAPPSAAFVAGMTLGVLALAHTRKDPGAVRRPSRGDVRGRTSLASRNRWTEMGVASGGATREAATTTVTTTVTTAVTKWADLWSLEQTEGGGGGGAGGGKDWCEACEATRPPRAEHCRVCDTCVRRRDHHCVWIDCCVGRLNHRSFLLTLLLFLSTSLYGIVLALQSVMCPRWPSAAALLLRLPGVYEQHATALVFTCAWYGSVVAAALLHLLVAQVINISHNVTGREARAAAREGTARRVGCWGLVVDTGVHSRGFWRNWAEFITMGDDLCASVVLPDGRSPTLTQV